MGAIGALDVDAVPAVARSTGRGTSTRVRSSSRRRAATGCRRSSPPPATRGVTTSFDTNWDPTDRWDGGVEEMLRASDVFFPNAAEARRIAGIDDVEAAARALAAIGSVGPRRRRTDRRGQARRGGALACRADGRIVRVPALPSSPIDTTGAGDSFDAGFPSGVARWRATSARASSSASSAARCRRARPGGVDGQATLAEARDATPPGGDERAWPRPVASGCSSSRRTRRSIGSYEVDRLVPGEIHRPQTSVAVAGGKGLNAARAAATLGGSVTAVGIVAGRAGDWIEERLAALGIDARMARGTRRDPDMPLHPRPIERA